MRVQDVHEVCPENEPDEKVLLVAQLHELRETVDDLRARLDDVEIRVADHVAEYH